MVTVRSLIVLCCVIVAVVAMPGEKYDGKYDNINLDEILGNKRLLQAYMDCILEKGKCTPEGKELQDHLQDALETGCEKCTDKQQEGSQKVIDHLIKNEKEMWKELTDKFDPEGKYRKKYEAIAKEHGITLE